MTAPLIRIALRWLGGILIANGYFSQGDAGLFTDPDMIALANYAAAALCAVASEGWYWLAKRFGWRT